MIEVEDLSSGIVRIRLDRADRRNALTDDMMARLQAALADVETNDSCRLVILTGVARAFCAGLDLKSNIEAHGHERSDAEAAMQLQDFYTSAIRMLRRLRQPVIAAVNGPAVGAGFGLALAADIRLGSPSASFHVGAVKVGLTAGECGISYHLPRLVGAGRAFEMMLTGRAVDADEAYRIGLITELVSHEELDGAAMRVAHAILANSTFSVQRTKALMWANLETSGLSRALDLENQFQSLGLLGTDFREAAQAFVEKRSPKFS
jgi:enoyl-CoA hydratase